MNFNLKNNRNPDFIEYNTYICLVTLHVLKKIHCLI
jgi:hypothetical protein